MRLNLSNKKPATTGLIIYSTNRGIVTVHYYQFNIKDYSFATIRMTLIEDLAFRRMLDLYYESEKPLPCELKRVSKLIGMSDHQEEIRSILNEFWTETELGWVNDRAEKEIVAYQAKADTARANGKLGGRPKKPTETQPVNLANPEITGSKANHKPLTINQELINNGFEHWWKLYPSERRTNKKGCLTKWKGYCKKLDDDAIENLVNDLAVDIDSRIKKIDDLKYFPQTTTYLNQEKWKDG